ncbi:hypothetical protein L7F22_033158 [Adiantum nelumboides]|nr:hypothetical protein [Adiantum nelumboides]
MAERGAIEWIETDACVKLCGLTRLWVGLSTDALLERPFIQRLCSSSCKDHCPNILDLFTKLAIEEGVYLPNLCEALAEMSKEFTKVTSISRRELEESKEASELITKQSLQDFDGFPKEPPFDSSAPHPQKPWMHAPSPFSFPNFPSPHIAEPPFPPLEEPPFPYAQPPLPFPEEPPPFPFAQSPFLYEPHLPPEGGPFIFPPFPQAPYVPPYFIEPPYYQQQPPTEYNSGGEPPFPATSPVYTQPEPTLMAPNLSPMYMSLGV